MRFPVLRERVRVQGRRGTFLVLSIDRARGVANVISAVAGGPVPEDVPLAQILPLVDEPARTNPPDKPDPGQKRRRR
jgi:hypothetical protein